MSQEITHDNKELFFDFFLFKNKYKDNLEELDEFISSFKIDNINKLSDLEGFFKGTMLKQVFLCLVDNKTNTVGLKNSKNGQKEVFNFLFRFEFSDIYQSRLPLGCCVAFGADIDPKRAVVNVKNIFITKLTSKPQYFESVIKDCRSRVIYSNTEISNEELLERNVLNSETVSKINKLLTNFENEALEWENYLDYLNDSLEIKRRLAIPFLNSEISEFIKIDKKMASSLSEEAIDHFVSSNYKYFDKKYESTFNMKNINYEIVNIVTFEIISDLESKKFNRIKKMDDLFLLPISSNKNIQNFSQLKNNIDSILNFKSLGENAIRVDSKIRLDILVGNREVGSLFNYWKTNGTTILGHFPDQLKEINGLETIENNKILSVSYEITNFDIEDLNKNDLLHSLKNGYLSYLGIGDETIIKRSRGIIKKIRNGWVKNPYLANYLFNTESIEVNNSEQEYNLENVNFYNELNHKQKVAVVKALNSKDIFLLQGPPGTGKTQVISEIVYQLANRNNKVLISSQNHEAINNVIDRLPLEPDLYKMRLSNVSFLENKNVNNFAPERLLLNYYNSVGKIVYDKVFQNGEDLKSAKEELLQIEKMLADFDSVKIKNDELSKISAKIESIKSEISLIQEKFNSENIEYEDLEEDIFQIENLSKNIETKNFDGVVPNNRIIIEVYEKVLKKNMDLLFQKISKEPSENVYKNIGYIWNRFVLNNKSYIDLLDLKNKLSSLSATSEYENVIKLKNEINDLELEIEKDKYISNLNVILNNFNRELNKKIKSFSKKNNSNSDQTKINSLNHELNNLLVSHSKIKKSISEVMGAVQSKVEIFNSLYGKNLNVLRDDYKKIITDKLQELDKKVDIFENNKQKLKPIYEKTLRFLGNHYELYYDSNKNNDSIKFNFQTLNETKKFLPILIKNLTNIYAMTLNSPSQFYFEKNKIAKSVDLEKIDLNNLNIDTVIIDEASKATMLEIIMPLVFGHSLILVGDYRQLPPLIKITQAEVDFINAETNKNYDFEKIYKLLDDSIFKKLITRANPTIKETLQVQYRSSRQIMEVVNNFYDGYLKIEDETDLKKFHNLKVTSSIGNSIISPEISTYWVDSSRRADGELSLEQTEDFSTSFYNDLEIDLTIEMIKKIDKSVGERKSNFSEKPSLGIICMYGLHVNKMKRSYKKISSSINNLKVIISTVDDFQGKECDFVIVNLVRNPAKISSIGQKFIKRYERINVAFSRARKLLIIIGSSRTTNGVSVKIPDMENPLKIKSLNVYDDILSYINFHKGYKTAKDIYE
ncbi:AAA domain-containing protein [Spiroplasma endosymbiont of Panorpa germanica]|uniref:AAA domain-containing protein n=1 Tax=Spiroplasma endosymbiont of Panorpa germanica TaxID=3066314 RepID=UPI0030CCE872